MFFFISQHSVAPSTSQTSISVYESSNDFESSQYGGIFFTHDLNSITSNNNNASFDETVTKTCAENTGDYVTVEQCQDFGGVRYIVK